MLLARDGALAWVGRTVQRVRNRLRRSSPPLTQLPQRLLRERDRILRTLGPRWKRALLATTGRWAFDYLTLLAALAAAALAHTVLFAAFTVGMGVVSAVAPLAAQAYGARTPRMVRRALRVGLWAAVMLGVPMTLVQFQGETILVALGQAPDAAALAGRYLAGMAWAILPGWTFIALRSFMGAVNRPEPALWITLTAIPINGVLAYALIHGAYGLPALDLLGAGLATAIVNACMTTLLCLRPG